MTGRSRGPNTAPPASIPGGEMMIHACWACPSSMQMGAPTCGGDIDVDGATVAGWRWWWSCVRELLHNGVVAVACELGGGAAVMATVRWLCSGAAKAERSE